MFRQGFHCAALVFLWLRRAYICFTLFLDLNTVMSQYMSHSPNKIRIGCLRWDLYPQYQWSLITVVCHEKT